MPRVLQQGAVEPGCQPRTLTRCSGRPPCTLASIRSTGGDGMCGGDRVSWVRNSGRAQLGCSGLGLFSGCCQMSSRVEWASKMSHTQGVTQTLAGRCPGARTQPLCEAGSFRCMAFGFPSHGEGGSLPRLSVPRDPGGSTSPL